MSAHRLYGVFFDVNHATRGLVSCWELMRNGRRARAYARKRKGLCASMPLPAGNGAWDAPTFRACADRVECDHRGNNYEQLE